NQVNYPLWQVIERVLDKSPALRYSSAPDLVKALQDAQHAGASGSMIVAPPQLGHQTTIYGVQPSPSANPYLNPIAPPIQGAGQLPPPVAYPYNPYSQPGQTAQSPHTPNFPQGFGNAPVYYPPPPRQPLIKPETKQFFGKFVISLVIMGSLFALIIVAINGISQALERTNNTRENATVVQQIKSIDKKKSLEEQISEMQSLIAKLKGDLERKEAKSNLAVLYEKVGKNALAQNDLVSAESAFRNSVDQDPDNGILYTNLGNLYDRRARAEQDVRTRISLWQQSAESWRSAATKEANPDAKNRYAEQTAIAYYNLAWEMNEDPGFPNHEIRSALYLAQDYAPTGSDVDRSIQLLFDQVRN
ncbi:MAG: hypothetical protein H7Y17_10880, partial [Chlorobia bacterium]|nr:hypothetical protein [Fimbriimonadaceae bacterium]